MAIKRDTDPIKHDDFFRSAIERYGLDKQAVKHNAGQLRIIHGAYNLTKDTFINFDPRKQYWYVPENLFLVGYFSTYWNKRFLPPGALRRLVFKTFQHFNEARGAGKLGKMPDTISDFWVTKGWKDIKVKLLRVIEELPEFPEYKELNRAMPKGLAGESHKTDMAKFLISLDEAAPLWSEAYNKRLAFFPYIGLNKIDELSQRQTFFWSYSTLFTSTNAYRVGGAQTFASIIQNNPTSQLFSFVKSWVDGKSLESMEMKVNTSNDVVECHRYMPVVELYGLLTLHKHPFYNQAAAPFYFSRFGQDLERDRANIFELIKRIEVAERSFLSDSPDSVKILAAHFDSLMKEERENSFNLTIMEGVPSEKLAKQFPDSAMDQIDLLLKDKLENAARFGHLTDIERATAMLNLILDVEAYKFGSNATPEIKIAETTNSKDSIDQPASVTTESESEGVTTYLPPSLHAFATEALAYLRAGKHVLLAGPPGTGKTTVAQFVGYAWNRNLSEVPVAIPRSAFPLTVVANSAWAPFHTIGGILPDGEGRFVAQEGIFIAPLQGKQSTWRLRSEAVVLDEMNRADLDRCIGELYPLLSNTTDAVSPAGIPGVSKIVNSPDFRLVCTVNDARLSDIVFPISEGLLRRFLRIELKGGTIGQIMAMIADGMPDSRNEHLTAAEQLLSELNEICVDKKWVEKSEEGQHLPFGVGYFTLLRDWAHGRLNMPPFFNDRAYSSQAKYILRVSLGSVLRTRDGFDKTLREFLAHEAA